MKSSKLLFVVVLFVTLVAGSARAQGKKVHVVCTLPTLKALTEEVGGERVDVIALAKGDQDPHFVTPTPVLMRKTREADLFIENGLSLELWADEVANERIRQKREAVFLCVVRAKNRPHVFEIKRVGDGPPPAGLRVENSLHRLP